VLAGGPLQKTFLTLAQTSYATGSIIPRLGKHFDSRAAVESKFDSGRNRKQMDGFCLRKLIYMRWKQSFGFIKVYTSSAGQIKKLNGPVPILSLMEHWNMMLFELAASMKTSWRNN